MGLAALGLVALVLGVAATASFFEVAVEEGGGVWWQIIISYGLALAVAGLAMGLVLVLVGAHVAATAEAWTALIAGSEPPRGEAGPGVLAVANLLTWGLTTWAGVARYQAGVHNVELGWAVQGMLLGLAGVVFGLLPAIPRLVTALRRSGAAGDGDPGGASGRRPGGRGAPRGARWGGASAAGGAGQSAAGRARRAAGEGAAVFVTLAALGLGLSMAVAEVAPALRFRGAERPIPYGDWADGCVDDELEGCERAAALRIEAPRAGIIRVEALQSQCAITVQREGVPVGTDDHLGADMSTRRDVSVGAGERVRVTVGQAAPPSVCTWSVRWRWAP